MGAFLKGYCVIRLLSIKTCKWDIVSGSCGVTYTTDFAKAARAEAVMALDSHDLCDGWHVSENEEEEGMEEK